MLYHESAHAHYSINNFEFLIKYSSIILNLPSERFYVVDVYFQFVSDRAAVNPSLELPSLTW